MLRKASTGFTLIEVLLAMTLLGIMMVLLFSSLTTGAESWNRGEQKIAEVNSKAVVYQFFKRHIPTTRPLWDNFSGDERYFSFQGEKNKLTFVSTFPASASRKGLQKFEINFIEQDEQSVNVAISPFFPTTEDKQWQKEEVVLLESVRDFKFSYFGQDTPNQEPSWLDQWQEKSDLPLLIKVNILLEDDSYWPEIILPLKLASSQVKSTQGGF